MAKCQNCGGRVWGRPGDKLGVFCSITCRNNFINPGFCKSSIAATYQIRRNNELAWDDLGRQAYQNDLERYSDLDSVESRRRQSRLDFFSAEAEWMGCQSTLQAMSYAMETAEEIEERERQVSDDG